jgi:hypothetical protein
MPVTRIRLYNEAKRKIHDNLGHKEHSIRYPHPHRLFVTKKFSPPPVITKLLHHRPTRALADVTKSVVSCIARNISAVKLYIMIY